MSFSHATINQILDAAIGLFEDDLYKFIAVYFWQLFFDLNTRGIHQIANRCDFLTGPA